MGEHVGGRFGEAAEAFKKANTANDGKLSIEEFTAALQRQDGNITSVGAAELMRRYTDTTTMTLPQFKKMAQDWSFGGRPIVHAYGERQARHFCFSAKGAVDKD